MVDAARLNPWLAFSGISVSIFAVCIKLSFPESPVTYHVFSIAVVLSLLLSVTYLYTNQSPHNRANQILMATQIAFSIGQLLFDYFVDFDIFKFEIIKIVVIVLYVAPALAVLFSEVNRHNNLADNREVFIDLVLIFIGISTFLLVIFNRQVTDLLEHYHYFSANMLLLGALAFWSFLIMFAMVIQFPRYWLICGLRSLMPLAILFFVIATFYRVVAVGTDLGILAQKIAHISLASAGCVIFAYVYFDLNIPSDYVKEHKHLFKNTIVVASILVTMSLPLSWLTTFLLNIPVDQAYLVGSAFINIIVLGLRLLAKLIGTMSEKNHFRIQAITDDLTGLFNRMGLRTQVSQLGNAPQAVFVIDINDFKAINEHYSYEIGDAILCAFALELKSIVEDLVVEQEFEVIISRLGGDEFCVVLYGEVDRNFFANQMIHLMPSWFSIEGRNIYVSFAIGVSFIAKQNFDSQLQEADFAMYEAKRRKKLVLPREEINWTQFGGRQRLRQEVRYALANDQVRVMLQPIYCLETGELYAFEALARLNVLGDIKLPSYFMHIINEDGLQQQLTEAIIDQISKSPPLKYGLRIGINLDPVYLSDSEALKQLNLYLEEKFLSPQRIYFEIIENSSINPEVMIEQIKILKSYGYKIAIDDFGSGFSNIERLTQFPVDMIKIDKSILYAAMNGNIGLLQSFIDLSKNKQCKTVLEGVETFDQLQLAKTLGIDYIQGFLTGKPFLSERLFMGNHMNPLIDSLAQGVVESEGMLI